MTIETKLAEIIASATSAQTQTTTLRASLVTLQSEYDAYVLANPVVPVVPAATPVNNYADWYWQANPGADPRTKTLTNYVVTSGANSGAGTWRDAVSQSNRRITFTPGLVVILTAPIVTRSNYLIVDGNWNVLVTRFATKFEGTGVILNGMRFADALGSAEEDCLTFRGWSGGPVQAFKIMNCSFDRANDGCIDIIYSYGRQVYGNVEGCTVSRVNKACLVDSGDIAQEGGTYNITFRNNRWYDVHQRLPMARNANIHIVGDEYSRYGDAIGAGGGAKAADGCKMLVENVRITRRISGEKTFEGVTVTSPRLEAVGPHMGSITGYVRAIGTYVAGTVVQKSANLVPNPPYVL